MNSNNTYTNYSHGDSYIMKEKNLETSTIRSDPQDDKDK